MINVKTSTFLGYLPPLLPKSNLFKKKGKKIRSYPVWKVKAIKQLGKQHQIKN